MCHLSPTVHLAWATLSCILQVFLVQHLWLYDRFKCISWSSGRQPGAFKRIMTYSYLTSVPSILVFTVSMAVLKYRNGYTFIPHLGTIPTPYFLWPSEDQKWIFPLLLLFSIAWALELVTHLEELTFWIFLLHQGPCRRDWFSSIEFKAWAVSSLVAVAGLPSIVIITRENPLKCEAYLFLTGGVASTCVTILFVAVLVRFPRFLRKVRNEGAAGPVILRLVKFHELNILRVIFRLMMMVPLIILGVDGVRNHHTINTSLLWTDLLAFMAAVGTITSSTFTLLIFFPRSLDNDSKWLPRNADTQTHGSFYSAGTEQNTQTGNMLNSKAGIGSSDCDTNGNLLIHSRGIKNKLSYYGDSTRPRTPTTGYYSPTLVTDSQARLSVNNVDLVGIEEGVRRESQGDHWRVSGFGPTPDSSGGDMTTYDAADPQQSENNYRHRAKRNVKDNSQIRICTVELAEAGEAGLKNPLRSSRLHPYIATFVSPIDLLEENPHVT